MALQKASLHVHETLPQMAVPCLSSSSSPQCPHSISLGSERASVLQISLKWYDMLESEQKNAAAEHPVH